MTIAAARSWSNSDIAQLKAIGISEKTIDLQLSRLHKGVPPIQLVRPCTPESGLFQLEQKTLPFYLEVFREARLAGRVRKFVPASGAATRMFKEVLQDLDTWQAGRELPPSLQRLADNITHFPFAKSLAAVLEKRGLKLSSLIENNDIEPVVAAMLDSEGLRLSSLPKGLLPFHTYGKTTRTPFEEHLVEAAAYTADRDGVARIHFTVAEKHHSAIDRHIGEASKRLSISDQSFSVSFSYQKSSTDAISLDENGKPLRNENSDLLLRPAGHGALLENINDIEGDILFITNIDNIVPDPIKAYNIQYKSILGGLLLTFQKEVFSFLVRLEDGDRSETFLAEVADFIDSRLSRSLPDIYPEMSSEGKASFLFEQLNRPLRVCGMVPNAGEPGGGPFWVRNSAGEISIQIVESAQVDQNNPEQANIWGASTHFNPVDLVCGVRDYQGRPFNLLDYSDPDACFISEKSHLGQKITVLELPGLWNGSMANWNSIFVEVPAETFNPVKTVFDLLRPGHFLG